jgi:hypothetical protein
MIYNATQTSPLLNVTMSGVLATMRRAPEAFIDCIWINRDVPVTFAVWKTSIAPSDGPMRHEKGQAKY